LALILRAFRTTENEGEKRKGEATSNDRDTAVHQVSNGNHRAPLQERRNEPTVQLVTVRNVADNDKWNNAPQLCSLRLFPRLLLSSTFKFLDYARTFLGVPQRQERTDSSFPKSILEAPSCPIPRLSRSVRTLSSIDARPPNLHRLQNTARFPRTQPCRTSIC
jgi:hypothetical protein